MAVERPADFGESASRLAIALGLAINPGEWPKILQMGREQSARTSFSRWRCSWRFLTQTSFKAVDRGNGCLQIALCQANGTAQFFLARNESVLNRIAVMRQTVSPCRSRRQPEGCGAEATESRNP